MAIKENEVLEFKEVDEGLQETLLVSGETSPLVTPERLIELHEQGLLTCLPINVEGVGTLLIPSEGHTVGSLKHYLLDLGGPMNLQA